MRACGGETGDSESWKCMLLVGDTGGVAYSAEDDEDDDEEGVVGVGRGGEQRRLLWL